MQLKIVTHFLVVSCLLSATLVTYAYPGGCYECEEEVWEEVPCDEIPSNSTTIEPPPFVHPEPCEATTSTPKPEPPTTTTTSTTSTTTTSTTTTTTTPKPTEPVSESPYKKCYCECKAGCKEFCRKVVVNPEVKKQIVQVSEFSEEVAQGRVECTHYHHRKLIPHAGYTNSQEAESREDPDSCTRQVPNSILRPNSLATAKIYNSNFIPSITTYIDPAGTGQITANSYTHTQAGTNDNYIRPDLSYTNKHQTYYFASPPSELYDFSMPYQGVYSKSVLGPEVSVASPNSIANPADFGVYSQSSGSYAPVAPVRNSQGTLANPVLPDDSFDTYFNGIIRDSRVSNFGNYETYNSGPHYSMSYR